MDHSYEEIRSVVLDILAGREKTRYSPDQYNSLVTGVAEVLDRREGSGSQNRHGDPVLSGTDRELCREVFWDLFRQGVITLGLNDSNREFPFFRVGHFGKRILENENGYFFQDLTSYVTLIRENIPNINDVTMLYLQEAMQAFAQAEYDHHRPDVVVGSSRGGAVAMNIDSGDTPVVLLCPAWKTWGTATTVKANTTILHSRVDETVPFADSEELVRNSGLSSGSLIEVGTEHRLADDQSLHVMAIACDRLSGCFEYFLVSQVARTHVVRFMDLAGVIRDREHTGVILNLDHELQTVVDREKWSSVILDFEGKEFGCCHAFQQMLVALHKKLGDGLKLCHLPPMVMEHLEWNRLAERLSICPTREDAIEAMKS